MESKEYVTYSRRAKAVEKIQQSVFKNSNSHGYRSPMASTKQWVEEASKQCKGSSIVKAEQQQQQQLYQRVGASTRGLNVSPCKTRSRKKDGRGVHFKQENHQTASSLESKVGNQASSLSSALVRKDGFPDNQAAALSPISLNVAVGGRHVVHASANVPAKHPQVSATLSQGVPPTQGQHSLIFPDGKVQSLPSGGDEEGRQVVWCNAAFEADDDLRSQDSVRSNRISTATCSQNPDSDVPFTVTVPSMNQKQDQEEWPSGISNVTGNPRAIFPSQIPSLSSANALAGSSPATVMTKYPEEDSRLPHISPMELESAAGWYTPMGSERSSHNSRSFAPGNEMLIDQSKRKTLAATTSCKVAMPRTPSHSNRPGSGARGRSASCCKNRNYPKYFTEVPSTCEAAGRKHSNPRARISYDTGPKSAKRVGGASVVVGKLDPRNFTSKVDRFQEDSMVEADLEADIEHEIEQEISMEILQLSERLAALHAKQETRRVGGEQERPKGGGISCPQTPLRNAPSSPCGSDTAKKRKGRVVAAKFLQSTTEGSNAKRDKSVNSTDPSAAKLLGLTDGPFLGRPNPPRRSLGTPSRLLTNGKPNGQQRNGSPNHMMKERTMGRPLDSDEQSRGNGPNKVTFEEYVRSRATLESGNRRVARVLHNQNSREEDRKEFNDRGIGQGKKMENPTAPTLCAGSTAVHPHFYPEFERKVDWVKTLRTDPLPAAHPCGTMSSTATALDERFLTQKPARQDVHAWLRENIGVAEGNSEIPNFPPHTCGTGMYDGGLQGGVQPDARKMMRTAEDGSINSRSTRPSNGWTSSLSNARTGTPNRPATPSRGSARVIPSRYGTPVKAVPSRDPGNQCSDSKRIAENSVVNPWYSQIGSNKRYSKDPKSAARKGSPTTRKGYPADSAIRSGCRAVGTSRGGGASASKDERGAPNNNAEISKEERKITVVEAEYEKFVEAGVRIEKRYPEIRKIPVFDGEHRDHGANEAVRPKTPSLTRQRDLMCEPPGSATKAAKKIYIKCSDLIKDKHSMLVKGKQRRLSGQFALPSEGQDSDASLFTTSNTRTDLSELDVNNSRSDTASIIEESTYVKNCEHLQRRVGEEGRYYSRDMTSFKSSEGSTPEYDIVYQYEAGRPRGSSYRPEDYTLDMMLQYVEDATLKLEREALPRIKAVKDVTAATTSPRDSGCIKRSREGEKRARFYFNEGGEANKVQVPKCASMDDDGLSPNEIEGLDLESFWCLVGDEVPKKK